MSETRKLAPILVANAVGHLQLAGDENHVLGRLRTLRNDPIDPTVAVCNGRSAKRAGDASTQGR